MPDHKRTQSPPVCMKKSRQLLKSVAIKDLDQAGILCFQNSGVPSPADSNSCLCGQEDCAPGICCSLHRECGQLDLPPSRNVPEPLYERGSCASECGGHKQELISSIARDGSDGYQQDFNSSDRRLSIGRDSRQGYPPDFSSNDRTCSIGRNSRQGYQQDFNSNDKSCGVGRDGRQGYQPDFSSNDGTCSIDRNGRQGYPSEFPSNDRSCSIGRGSRHRYQPDFCSNDRRVSISRHSRQGYQQDLCPTERRVTISEREGYPQDFFANNGRFSFGPADCDACEEDFPPTGRRFSIQGRNFQLSDLIPDCCKPSAFMTPKPAPPPESCCDSCRKELFTQGKLVPKPAFDPYKQSCCDTCKYLPPKLKSEDPCSHDTCGKDDTELSDTGSVISEEQRKKLWQMPLGTPPPRKSSSQKHFRLSKNNLGDLDDENGKGATGANCSCDEELDGKTDKPETDEKRTSKDSKTDLTNAESKPEDGSRRNSSAHEIKKEESKRLSQEEKRMSREERRLSREERRLSREEKRLSKEESKRPSQEN
ncbi:uncharacterized protein LOC126056159 [Helicoverpa armigera]|uniref:uncharacterized protein LOC126056159 n=1 Tax=Helicoverpa armigera TaxID=29058 RepID=UPI003083EBF2